jgi:integration host factor subunit beta
METISKKELVDRIADELNNSRPRSPIKRVHVKRVVQRFLDSIIEELAKGNRLEFREFGVFESKLRAARQAQNPKTLERVSVPAKRSVKFKVGRMMKERLLKYSLPSGASSAGQTSEISSREEHTTV